MNFEGPNTSLDRRKARCLRCHGTGKVRRYQHIDNGKCFSCNGAGWTWSEVGPPPELRPVPLFVTLRDIQREAPQHDCFGHLGRHFQKSYESLLSAMGGEPDMNASISIGDIARTFGPGTSIWLGLQIPGIDLRVLTRMILPSAERAAAATGEHSLGQVVVAARKLIDTQEEVAILRPILRSPSGRSPEAHARSCGEALAAIARRGSVDQPERYRSDCTWTLAEATSVFGEIARQQGADVIEAIETEHKRQVEDICAVSPIHALRDRSVK